MAEKPKSRPQGKKPGGTRPAASKAGGKPKPNSQKPVALFTAPGCSWCDKAKKYLKNKGIRFRTIDISKDAKAAKDCMRHGCRGVPVVLIGNRWICGFDQKNIDKELGLS
ncbi:glutaredoxin domain-containing protein [Sulfurimonas sp. HSL1-6]|uniref:glutaredoxin family protein n=1 Tax=Thiomicrolovo immobilis TaxID=3131935 RepID=UPI0031F827EE